MTPFSFGADPSKRWWHVSSFSITSSSIIAFQPLDYVSQISILPQQFTTFCSICSRPSSFAWTILEFHCFCNRAGTSGNSICCSVPLGTWSTSSLPIKSSSRGIFIRYRDPIKRPNFDVKKDGEKMLAWHSLSLPVVALTTRLVELHSITSFIVCITLTSDREHTISYVEYFNMTAWH